jgi:membrane-associated phospholipid phosphatase
VIEAGRRTRVPAGPAWTRWFFANLASGVLTLLRSPLIRTRPAWHARALIVAAAAAWIAATAAAMVLIDGPAVAAARQLPRWLIDLFEQITDFGLSGWTLGPLAFLLAVIAACGSPALPRLTQRVMAAIAVRLGFLFCAIAVPGLFVTVVKRLIGRGRPFVGGVADPFLYAPFAWRPEYASLPSGHTVNVFAALVAFGALFPRLRAVLWIYALVIAASRVIVMAHHPSDVIAGTAVGVIGALLVRDWFAVRRLGFVIAADGQIRALPGPSWRRTKRVARQLIAS